MEWNMETTYHDLTRFLHGLGTDADPAHRYSNRDAPIAPGPLLRLPFFGFKPGPRGLALFQTTRSLGKGSGDHSNNGRETNRHTQSGSHQADTSRRPSAYADVISALPACTDPAGRS